MPKLNTPNMSAPFWQVSCEATFLQERIWLAVPGLTWRRVCSPWPHHHESVRHYRCGRNPSCRARENSLVAKSSICRAHPFLYGDEQLPELPGGSKKLVSDRKQTSLRCR